jgi:hypothetical protein
LSWIAAWDTPADAEEFAAALSEALRRRLGGAQDWRGQNGIRVLQSTTATLELKRSAPARIELRGTFSTD